jgi:uncharacterized membrane protein
MNVSGIINEYFLNPMIERTGYNEINTLVYAIIAVSIAYIVYKLFTINKIKINKEFILRVIPFILLGSTMRVITDSIDTGRMVSYEGFFQPVYEMILNTGIYNYGFLTVTPGIYVSIGIFTIVSIYLSYKYKKENYGSYLASFLFIFHFLLLFPMFTNILYGILILLGAGLIVGVYLYFKKQSNLSVHWYILLAQTFDGMSTFVTLDIFNRFQENMYAEQHVVANVLSEMFGNSMLPFLVVKILLSLGIIYLLEKEKNNNERYYIALLVIIFGLAPGIRNTLRLICGA